MRYSQLQASVIHRLHNPIFWIVSGVTFLSPLVQLLTPTALIHPMELLRVTLLVDLWIPLILFSPVPWQWSSDGRPLAHWLRGCIQFGIFAIFGAALMLAIMRFHTPSKTPFAKFLLESWADLLLSMVLLIPVGLSIAWMERSRQETHDAQQRAQEAKWMSHRGAFSPRLLLSNLQHLADQAPQNSEVAEQGLVDLAALYRQWLIEAEKPLITLMEERALAEQYLAMERPRWGERLRVRWHLEPDLDAYPVPSLLLLQLLEALLSPGPEAGPVQLDIHMEAEAGLHIRVGIKGNQPDLSSDVLPQLRQRIRAHSSGAGDIQSTHASDPNESSEILIRFPSDIHWSHS